MANEETIKETKEEVKLQPVFEEVNTMDQNTAMNVLIQVAEMAQKGGLLSMRDSVILANLLGFCADSVRTVEFL